MHLPITIRRPQPYDIIGMTVAWRGQTAEARGSVLVELLDGADRVLDRCMVHAGPDGQVGTFSGMFHLTRPPSTSIGTVAVGDPYTLRDRCEVPVVFGPHLLERYMTYTQLRVRSGDTLRTLAEAQYGTAARWTVLWEANRHTIVDPEVLLVGQTLRVPLDRVPD